MGQFFQIQDLGAIAPEVELAMFGMIVLIADLLNSPNATKLPLLLEVAKDPQHPKAVEAKDLLELYLEEDYGQNWEQWQAKTEKWLKDNPD